MQNEQKLLKLKWLPCIIASFLVALLSIFLLSCVKSIPIYYTKINYLLLPIDRLRLDGVQIIHLGETYRLVIHSVQLFNPNSANLRDDADILLNHVARFLNEYHIVTIKINAYSDNIPNYLRIRSPKSALTQQQATVIQDYLSNRGLNARLIYAKGSGDQHLAVWNDTASGRYANRRIEISFMYSPKTTVYTVRVKRPCNEQY